MGVYCIRVVGRNDPIYLRAKNKSDAVAAVVTGDSLTADEVEETFDSGVKIWKPGDPLPEDSKPPADLAPEAAPEPEPEPVVEASPPAAKAKGAAPVTKDESGGDEAS